jgi:phosphate starvation-inducible protein PhoH and related proteins
MVLRKGSSAGEKKTRRSKKETAIITNSLQQSEAFPQSNEYKTLHPKNDNQRKYLQSLIDNTITIASGPPGTAKTLLALYYAFHQRKSGAIDKIYYIKPFVGSKWERDIGSVPGEAEDKLAFAMLDPVKLNLTVFMSEGECRYHIEKKNIEPVLFANIRGASYRNAIILLDEAQNVPPEAIKTALTRLGTGSKIVIMGDPRQSDIDIPVNGLSDAVKRLAGIPEIGIVNFTKDDIVRHGLIKTILQRYGE